MDPSLQNAPPRRVTISNLQGPAELNEHPDSDTQGHLIVGRSEFAEFNLDPCALIVLRPYDQSLPIVCGHFAMAPEMPEMVEAFFHDSASIISDGSNCRVDCFGVCDVNEFQWSGEKWNVETVRKFVVEALLAKGFSDLHTTWPAPGRFQDVLVNGLRRTLTYAEYRE